jgi:hypothetical protein
MMNPEQAAAGLRASAAFVDEMMKEERETQARIVELLGLILEELRRRPHG